MAVGAAASDAVEESLVGARRHAGALLPMAHRALARRGIGLDGVEGLALSDGPGSFTGLRVGASVAKALVQARGLPLWTAPSLMVRARGAGQPGRTILAVANALRGELYAAAYRFEAEGVRTLLAPSVHRPDALVAGTVRPDFLVGEAPEPAARLLEAWAGAPLVGPPEGAPHARVLLGLVDLSGGASRVECVQGWEPVYGRPAEAQARWETAHGRPLSHSVGSSG